VRAGVVEVRRVVVVEGLADAEHGVDLLVHHMEYTSEEMQTEVLNAHLATAEHGVVLEQELTGQRGDVALGFGHIVVSEVEAPNMLVHLV
jgi:hypothetical protein